MLRFAFISILTLYRVSVDGSFLSNDDKGAARILAPDYGHPENSLVAAFFQNYRSNMPVVMLVDKTMEAHEDAQKFLDGMEQLNVNTIMVDFLLMKFNSTEVTPVLASYSENKFQFRKLLQWSESYELFSSSSLGSDGVNGSAVFLAVLQASQILPSNGALLIFTDRAVADEDLATLALSDAAKKRIRIFVAWGGIVPGFFNEEKVLREAALYSRGAFFVNNNRKLSDKYNRFYMGMRDSSKSKPVVLLRRNIHGKQHFDFPIDSDATGVHISLSVSAVSAVLRLPNGYVLDILNATEVASFSVGSFVVNETLLDSYEVQLTLARRSTPGAGTWRLYVDDAGAFVGYNVTVSLQTELHASVSFPSEFSDTSNNNKCTACKKQIKIEFSGDVLSVDQVTFVDQNGNVLQDAAKEDLTFNTIKNQELTEDTESIETNVGNQLNIEAESLPDVPFYIKINGKDVKGNEFARISYVNSQSTIYKLPALSVELGVGSELLAMPNQFVKLYFEISNNRDQTVFLRFRCTDEKSLLVSMIPVSTWLNPQQTVIVTVSVRTPTTTSSYYTDLISFRATGPEVVTKSASMLITSDRITDYDDPYITHKYTSDCMNVLLGSCEDGTWTIEVTAQDTGSGLMQLISNPKGLYFPNGYTAGTTERVTGYFSDTCCRPKLQITATDRVGNRRTYTADAYYSALSPGSIAAIVLGCILLILIIIAIIVICRMKCCKSRDSVDLPTYRGPSGSSRY